MPPPILKRAPASNEAGHHADWIHAAKTGEPADSNFAIAGPFTEWILLGTLALRFEGKLEWDSEKMKTNNPEANKLIKPTYRKGWTMERSRGSSPNPPEGRSKTTSRLDPCRSSTSLPRVSIVVARPTAPARRASDARPSPAPVRPRAPNPAPVPGQNRDPFHILSDVAALLDQPFVIDHLLGGLPVIHRTEVRRKLQSFPAR